MFQNVLNGEFIFENDNFGSLNKLFAHAHIWRMSIGGIVV